MGKLPTRAYRKLYLGEWMERLGCNNNEVAKAASVDPSYISNLVAGRKPNPSSHVLIDISEFLEITVNDLYRPPPPQSATESLSRLSPAAMSRLFEQSRRK